MKLIRALKSIFIKRFHSEYDLRGQIPNLFSSFRALSILLSRWNELIFCERDNRHGFSMRSSFNDLWSLLHINLNFSISIVVESFGLIFFIDLKH